MGWGYGLGIGWVWEGEFREVFSSVFGWVKGGLLSDFACLFVQPLMCLALENQTQERNWNVCVFIVFIVCIFNLINI